MSSTPHPTKQPKQSKHTTESDTSQEKDALPKSPSSILTLRTTIVLVVILCLAIQQFVPSTFLTALFGTGNTDTSSPTRTSTAAGSGRGGSDTHDSGGGGGGKTESSTWDTPSSTKSIMFGTPDPLGSTKPSGPASQSSSKGSTQSGRQRRRRGDSPFHDFFKQGEEDQPQAQEVTCNQYFCHETGACVERPIDCPCQYEQDTKCPRGDWYSCHRGPYDCNLSR